MRIHLNSMQRKQKCMFEQYKLDHLLVDEKTTKHTHTEQHKLRVHRHDGASKLVSFECGSQSQ